MTLTGVSQPPEARRDSSILIQIRGAMPNLRPAEQRVALAALADPAAVSESSITTVARQCQTSETTVLRFCRALGLAGYPELRIALARAAQVQESGHHSSVPPTSEIDPSDSLRVVVSKIAYADACAIEDTASALDLDVLDRVVDVLVTARRIDVYGAGASALVSNDLHQKLHRVGRTSFAWADPHLALTSAAVLTPADAAVGISHTGSTVDTIDALREARRAGATTIAITNFGRAPITAEVDHVLLTAARETTFRTGAMASRIAQLALVDCLFAAVAQRTYRESLAALETTYAAVHNRHSTRHRR